MADNKPAERDELEHRKGHSFPLVMECDMHDEMQAEAADLCVTGKEVEHAKFVLIFDLQLWRSIQLTTRLHRKW